MQWRPCSSMTSLTNSASALSTSGSLVGFPLLLQLPLQLQHLLALPLLHWLNFSSYKSFHYKACQDMYVYCINVYCTYVYTCMHMFVYMSISVYKCISKYASDF